MRRGAPYIATLKTSQITPMNMDLLAVVWKTPNVTPANAPTSKNSRSRPRPIFNCKDFHNHVNLELKLGNGKMD